MASHAAYRPWRGHATGQVGDLKRQSHHICPRQCNPELVFRLIELTTGFLLSCSGNAWYLSALVWWCFLEVGSSLPIAGKRRHLHTPLGRALLRTDASLGLFHIIDWCLSRVRNQVTLRKAFAFPTVVFRWQAA